MVFIKDITKEEREKRVRLKEISSLVEEYFPLKDCFLISFGLEGYCGVYYLPKLKNILDVHFSSPESPRFILRDQDFYNLSHSLAQKIEQKGAKVVLSLDYSK